jgi:hypothetical protein
MGLRCSIRGHRFEEPGLVHEREPRGDEVITIQRKVMVCTLCGEQRVLAEKKEITKREHTDELDDSNDTQSEPTSTINETSKDTAETDGVTADSDDITADTPDTPDTANSQGETDDVVTEGMSMRDNDPTTHETSESESTGISGVDVIDNQGIDVDDSQSGVDTRQDDGIVLTDDEGGREYGEWPIESNGTGTTDQWEPDYLRAEIESTDFDMDDMSNMNGNGHTDSSAIVDSETDDGEIIEADEESEPRADDHTKETLHCPSCDFTVSVPDSPFRSGDSCPECRKEYLIDGT